MKLVKFIKYYSQFKPLRMNPQREQEILQRLSDSFDTDLDFYNYKTPSEDESNNDPHLHIK